LQECAQPWPEEIDKYEDDIEKLIVHPGRKKGYLTYGESTTSSRVTSRPPRSRRLLTTINTRASMSFPATNSLATVKNTSPRPAKESTL